MSTQRLIIYSTWFQVIWFLAILGQYDWQLLTLCFTAGTLALSIKYENLKLARWFSLLVVGVALDYINFLTGLFQFNRDSFPLWLVGVWAIFLWYAFYLIPILNRYPVWLVSVMSGGAAVMSYLAGMKLNAVSFPMALPTTLVILFLEWVVMINIIRKVYSYERCIQGNQKGAHL